MPSASRPSCADVRLPSSATVGSSSSSTTSVRRGLRSRGRAVLAMSARFPIRFGISLRELAVRHIQTQVNTPWTNGKIEAFWATLKSEVLDRQIFRSLADAEAALADFARYYNYHRLHGEIGWLTPAERYDGTPF